MSEFLAQTFYGNTIGDWAISFGIVVGAVLAGKALYYFFSRILKAKAEASASRLDDLIVDMIEEPIVVVLMLGGFWFGMHRLEFGDAAELWVSRIFHVAVALTLTWLVARLVDSLIEQYVVPLTEKSETDLDDQLLPIARRGITITIWGLGIIMAMNNAGYDITALIAGAGIGGLALAMAAQDSVSNFFGGVTIFADKPFTIRDRVRVSGYDGFIEEIGIRSTRLRTLAGPVVTIPNSTFTDNPVENVTSEPAKKIVLELGLTYDTTADQMEAAMALLREIAVQTEHVSDECITAFMAFGDFSLGITFVYFIEKSGDFFATQNEVNLRVLRAFNEAGLNMAFPTQTLEAKVELSKVS